MAATSFADKLKAAQDKIKAIMVDDDSTDNSSQITAVLTELNAGIIASGKDAVDFMTMMDDGWKKAMGESFFTKDGSESKASAMTKSIQGVTEDTANKLIGYINTITQFSALNKVSIEKILNVIGLDGIYGQSIKSNALLADIKSEMGALNQTTTAIHNSIKSVITPSPSGGMGFRVV